jgi:hypothetical protein
LNLVTWHWRGFLAAYAPLFMSQQFPALTAIEPTSAEWAKDEVVRLSFTRRACLMRRSRVVMRRHVDLLAKDQI